MSDWHPIETAPRDGTEILIFRKGRVVAACWDIDKYANNPRPFWSGTDTITFGKLWSRNVLPTHWMPLPAPPVFP